MCIHYTYVYIIQLIAIMDVLLFCSNFFSALHTTHWYRSWVRDPPSAIVDLPTGQFISHTLSLTLPAVYMINI